MVYLFAVLVLMVIATMHTLPFFKGLAAGRKVGAKMLVAFTESWLAILAGAPLFYGVLLVSRMNHGGGIDGDASMRIPVGLMLGAGVVAAIWYGYRFHRERKSYSVLAGVAGVYLAYAGIDHLRFFHGDQAGVVSAGYYQAEGKVRDMPADCGSIALVDGAFTGTATYRCPNFVVLGGWTSNPFVPWPSYTEGQSRDLSAAIQASYENAIKP